MPERGSFLRGLEEEDPGYIAKATKSSGQPSAYRPICLIDSAGKVLEKIILNILLRSTVDAILSVTKTSQIAFQRKRRGIRYCTVVILDARNLVRNAFNSASWAAIADIPEIPGYLYMILGSYFQNRVRKV